MLTVAVAIEYYRNPKWKTVAVVTVTVVVGYYQIQNLLKDSKKVVGNYLTG